MCFLFLVLLTICNSRNPFVSNYFASATVIIFGLHLTDQADALILPLSVERAGTTCHSHYQLSTATERMTWNTVVTDPG